MDDADLQYLGSKERSKYQLFIKILNESDDEENGRYRDKLVEIFEDDIATIEEFLRNAGVYFDESPIEYTEEQELLCAKIMEFHVDEIYRLMKMRDRALAVKIRRELFSPDVDYPDENIDDWILDYEGDIDCRLIDLRNIELDGIDYPDAYYTIN